MNESFLKYSDKSGKIDIIKKCDKEKKFNSIVTDLKVSLMYYKYKLENKIMKSPKLDENFLKEIQNLVEKIKKYFREENPSLGYICYDDDLRTILILEYSTLLTIIDILVNILEKIKKIEELENFSLKKFHLDFNVREYNAKDIIENFSEIKTLKIRLNGKNEEKINEDVITLFSYFIPEFFPSCIQFDFDFNIIPINKEYNKINPYEINEENIISYCKDYESTFISNLILLKSAYSIFNVNSLSIKIYDSYQIESHYILSKIISDDENCKNKSKIEKNSDLRTMASSSEYQRSLSLNSPNYNYNINPFMNTTGKNIINYNSILNNKLMKFEFFLNNFMSKYFEMKYEINSFDPLLFNYCNLSLIKDENLYNLKLNLFPSEKISLRKILINSEKYNLYLKSKINVFSQLNNTDENQMKHYKSDNNIIENPINDFVDFEIYDNKHMLYFNYITKKKMKDNKLLLLKDEEIINKLFNNFNQNLFDLSIILDHKMGDFTKLSINLSNYLNLQTNIENYDNYNSSITCFIINLFISIQKLATNLNYLEIKFDDDNLHKKNLMEIFKKKRYYVFENGFKFNNLIISELIFDFNNVCSYIKFENFPPNLSFLKIKKLSSNDFKLFIQYYQSKKNIFNKLETLCFSFDYDMNFKIELIEQFILLFREHLKVIFLDIPININFDLLTKLIKSYKNNKSNSYLKIKIILNEINHHFSTGKRISDCKIIENELIHKRKIVKSISYFNFNHLILEIPFYNSLQKNKLLSLIYCFKKINKNKNEKKMENIYKNIFYKMSNLNYKKMEVQLF